MDLRSSLEITFSIEREIRPEAGGAGRLELETAGGGGGVEFSSPGS